MAAKTVKTCSGSAAFTMAEMLIALVIMAILLTAIATAFHASSMNYRENSGIAEAMNSARNALARMTTLIRTGQPNPANEAVGTCSLDGGSIVFSYNSAQKKLYYVTGGVSSVLCDNVTSLTFTKSWTGPDVKSVVISMTIQIGDVTETFTSAAVVRKNL
jgi:prepilin-type N-terminal cleavage/methylation domain-containing protein